MWIFQAPYNAIKRWKCKWFTQLMGIIQNQVLWPAIKAVGDAGKNYIQSKIEEAAQRDDIDNLDKLKWVFEECRKRFTVALISDDLLANLIQNLYSVWKRT